MTRFRVGVDYDGVLYDPFHEDEIPDAMFWLERLIGEGCEVSVTSARSRHPLKRWLMMRSLRWSLRDVLGAESGDQIYRRLRFPIFKRGYDVLVDDRVWRFELDAGYPPAHILRHHRPWWWEDRYRLPGVEPF